MDLLNRDMECRTWIILLVSQLSAHSGSQCINTQSLTKFKVVWPQVCRHRLLYKCALVVLAPHWTETMRLLILAFLCALFLSATPCPTEQDIATIMRPLIDKFNGEYLSESFLVTRN